MQPFMRRIRSLARTPWYAVTAITCIAVGLALSTATFALVDRMLHPSVPYDDPSLLFTIELRLGNQRTPPPLNEQMRLLGELRAVQGVGASAYRREAVALGNDTRGVSAFSMTRDLFQVLGVRLEKGRWPTADEAREGRVALVNAQVWHSEFGNRETIRGESVRVGDRDYTVVGVLPRNATARSGFGVWIPFEGNGPSDTLRASFFAGSARIFVRLKPGETPLSAQPDLDRVASDLSRQYVSPGIVPYRLLLSSLRPQMRNADALTILLYVVAFGILAIACTNVTALTLARGLTRRRDYALRRALGARSSAIAFEVVSEVSIVTLVGTALGLGLTFALLGVFGSVIPVELTWSGVEPPDMSWRVFAFVGFALAVSTAIAGGLPAYRATRVSPSDPLKDGAGTTTGRSRSEFRALVMGELAVATVLLMMASLVSLSAKNMLGFDFGFDTDRMLQAQVNIPRRAALAAAGRAVPGPRTAVQDTRNIRDRALEAIRATPGVLAAAQMYMVNTAQDRRIVSDRTAAGDPDLTTRLYFTAGAGFFSTLGVPVLQGREFEPGDQANARTAVLSARAAAVLFPKGDAVGRRIKVGKPERPGEWATVIGVTRDFQLAMSPDPDLVDPPVFFPTTDSTGTYFAFAIRTQAANDVDLIRAVQNRIRSTVDPGVRVYAGRWMANYDYAFRIQAFFTKVFTSLGLAALVLGALGLFSVLSYTVNQRSREFAVRTSLGATPGRLISHVMRSAFEFALGGTAIGALLSFWASAGVSSMLFGVKNTDPVSLIITEVVLISTCLLAALAPALRASRANPLDIIRAV